MRNNAHQDELKDAPILRSLHREDPFIVPSQFFDRFPAHVQQRIGRVETPPLFSWARLRIPAAAALAVAVLAILFWRPTSVQPSLPVTPMEVASVPYDTDIYELNDHELMAAYSEYPDLYTEVGHGFGSDELTAYLLNEDLSLDQLIEEL